jgi:4-hydroxy-tetrahydrodipicolinate reductase
MTRVAIHGAAGRMGRNLVLACHEHPELELVLALDHAGHEALGQDAGRLAGLDDLGVAVSSEAGDAAFDVAIDFTRPDGTLAMLDACRRRGAPIVIGTTGFDPEQRATLGAAGQDLAVLVAANTGVGLNLLTGLVERAAAALGNDYDAEVVEAHHRHKVDAPSGTALHLGEAVARGRGVRLEDRAVYARQGHTGERLVGEIGFATVRGGDIVGEHSVLFAGPGERIEITHRASSRMLFARGAVRAAAWLHGQDPGLYSMQDVLGLRD